MIDATCVMEETYLEMEFSTLRSTAVFCGVDKKHSSVAFEVPQELRAWTSIIITFLRRNILQHRRVYLPHFE